MCSGQESETDGNRNGKESEMGGLIVLNGGRGRRGTREARRVLKRKGR